MLQNECSVCVFCQSYLPYIVAKYTRTVHTDGVCAEGGLHFRCFGVPTSRSDNNDGVGNSSPRATLAKRPPLHVRGVLILGHFGFEPRIPRISRVVVQQHYDTIMLQHINIHDNIIFNIKIIYTTAKL